MTVKALLTVTLPGQDTPSLALLDDGMVLHPGDSNVAERDQIIALLIEALVIMSPPNPRHEYLQVVSSVVIEGADGTRRHVAGSRPRPTLVKE